MKRTYDNNTAWLNTYFGSRRKAHADIDCPIEEGEHTVVHTVELPKEIPKGAYIQPLAYSHA